LVTKPLHQISGFGHQTPTSDQRVWSPNPYMKQRFFVIKFTTNSGLGLKPPLVVETDASKRFDSSESMDNAPSTDNLEGLNSWESVGVIANIDND